MSIADFESRYNVQLPFQTIHHRLQAQFIAYRVGLLRGLISSAIAYLVFFSRDANLSIVQGPVQNFDLLFWSYHVILKRALIPLHLAYMVSDSGVVRILSGNCFTIVILRCHSIIVISNYPNYCIASRVLKYYPCNNFHRTSMRASSLPMQIFQWTCFLPCQNL